MDNGEWHADVQFYIELFQVNISKNGKEFSEVLRGADTRCRILILEDDQPGHISIATKPDVQTSQVLYDENHEMIGFKKAIRANPRHRAVQVDIVRTDGEDGDVTVYFRTE